MNEPREIILTPNYAAMFRTMLDELKRQGKAESMFDAIVGGDVEAGCLRAVQRFLAPLTIALSAATSVAEIKELRGVVTDMLSDVDRTAAQREREMAEAREEA